MNRHFHIYYFFDIHLFNVSTYRENLKVGIELKNGIKSGQSVINKKGFIRLFRMFGGVNVVCKGPKSARNVLRILWPHRTGAQPPHFCRDSPNTNDELSVSNVTKFPTRDKRNY